MLRHCARDNRHAGVIVSPTMSSFRRTALIIKTVISSMTCGSAPSDPVRQAIRDALIRLHGCAGGSADDTDAEQPVTTRAARALHRTDCHPPHKASVPRTPAEVFKANILRLRPQDHFCRPAPA